MTYPHTWPGGPCNEPDADAEPGDRDPHPSDGWPDDYDPSGGEGPVGPEEAAWLDREWVAQTAPDAYPDTPLTSDALAEVGL